MGPDCLRLCNIDFLKNADDILEDNEEIWKNTDDMLSRMEETLAEFTKTLTSQAVVSKLST